MGLSRLWPVSPLVREGALHQEASTCQTKEHVKSGHGPQRAAWHQNRLADWPSVANSTQLRWKKKTDQGVSLQTRAGAPGRNAVEDTRTSAPVLAFPVTVICRGCNLQAYKFRINPSSRNPPWYVRVWSVECGMWKPQAYGEPMAPLGKWPAVWRILCCSHRGSSTLRFWLKFPGWTGIRNRRPKESFVDGRFNVFAETLPCE
jgi:hypothetical protein